MDLKNFASAIAQIAEEKGIQQDKVMEVIEQAIAAAYKRDYGQRGQIIKAKLDPKTGDLRFWQVKLAVDEGMIYSEEELAALKEGEPRPEDSGRENLDEEKVKKIRFNPERHMMIDEAKKAKKGIKPGEELEIALETKGDYGRIAAQTAKQVVLQRIREAEREVVLTEFRSKEGEVISGVVQRVEPRAVFFDIGKSVGTMPREEQVPGEFYRPGQRLKVYVLKVEESPRGPLIFLSRAYPKLVSKLFEIEVPEVLAGSVVIKSIAREAGSRSKIAVASEAEGVDPIGSMVGQRGARVSAVINELGGEKIDIIEWSENPDQFITNALSPAKATEVKIMPKNKALALVPEDQLSLAIGKDGQNVRLAAKLTGWKIDVRSAEKPEEVSEGTSKEVAEDKEPKEEKKKAKKKNKS